MILGLTNQAKGIEKKDILTEYYDIQTLNEIALLNTHDVIKVSAAHANSISDHYDFLTCGGAMGLNCGPLLISINEITDELCNLRVELNIENNNFTFLEIERELRIRVADVFNELFVFGNNRVRVRVLEPAGCLLVFGTAGIFWPFSGEGYVDSGLDSLVIPFTMAHEFAHGFGWTDEGECNFIALLACRKSDKGLIRYSAELSYWRYLMSNAFRIYPELYKKYLSEISIPIQRDLKSIDYHNNQFPEILPELRDWFYDRYLIFNGVKGGSQSYTGIIKWVINYRKRRI